MAARLEVERIHEARNHRPLAGQEREELLTFGKERAVSIGPLFGPVV